MRSLTVFLFALVLLVLGVHSNPDHPDKHQQGENKSCDESSTVLMGLDSTTSPSPATTTSGPPLTASTTTASTPQTITTTTTITSTRTNTVTVTSPIDGSCTSIPMTTSAIMPTGVNTTTSTKHLTNVTNSTHPATSAPNATVPKPTISPSISGFQGVAAGLSSQSPASVFALGCLVFMAALLV